MEERDNIRPKGATHTQGPKQRKHHWTRRPGFGRTHWLERLVHGSLCCCRALLWGHSHWLSPLHLGALQERRHAIDRFARLAPPFFLELERRPRELPCWERPRPFCQRLSIGRFLIPEALGQALGLVQDHVAGCAAGAPGAFSRNKLTHAGHWKGSPMQGWVGAPAACPPYAPTSMRTQDSL